jgi:hypothetical protein
MKKLTAIAALVVVTSSAWAADLPPAPRAPVPYMPVAVPVFSWTGFYCPEPKVRDIEIRL